MAYLFDNTWVNPVKNSSGALNPAGIILKSNPAAELRGIISNGVNNRRTGVSPVILSKNENASKPFPSPLMGEGAGGGDKVIL